MQWTGVIIMDCWGEAWHDTSPKSHGFYQQVLRELNQLLTDSAVIVEATYAKSGGSVIDPMFQQLICGQRYNNIRDWAAFARHGLDHGDWLLVGQSWNVCIHQRMLGVIPYVQSTALRCRVWSHPALVDHATQVHRPVTDQDFIHDPRVCWLPGPRGFFRAQREAEKSSRKT